jgi:hypothetical protein
MGPMRAMRSMWMWMVVRPTSGSACDRRSPRVAALRALAPATWHTEAPMRVHARGTARRDAGDPPRLASPATAAAPGAVAVARSRRLRHHHEPLRRMATGNRAGHRLDSSTVTAFAETSNAAARPSTRAPSP